MTAVCEILNLLHFRFTVQRGTWPKWSNCKYATALLVAYSRSGDISSADNNFITRMSEISWCSMMHFNADADQRECASLVDISCR